MKFIFHLRNTTYSKMWAKIDSDTKERFEKKAKAAKEKYEEEYKVGRLTD